jgi:hypothetical protein
MYSEILIGHFLRARKYIWIYVWSVLRGIKYIRRTSRHIVNNVVYLIIMAVKVGGQQPKKGKSSDNIFFLSLFFCSLGKCALTSVSGASHNIKCETPIGTHRQPPAYTHTAKKVSQPSAMLGNSQVA